MLTHRSLSYWHKNFTIRKISPETILGNGNFALVLYWCCQEESHVSKDTHHYRDIIMSTTHILSNQLLDTTHYNDVVMGGIASQITSLTIVYSTIHSGAVQRKHQSSAPLAFVMRIHRWALNSSPKGPVTREMFPFDDVIMLITFSVGNYEVNHHANPACYVKLECTFMQ